MTGEDSSLSEKPIDVGAVLRKAREQASYSTAFVADQIHLSEHVVEALEANEFEQLPGPVFVRGYIRSYAKLLDTDPQPLIEQIEGGPRHESDDSVLGQPIKIKSSRLDPIVVWSAVTVLIVAIGLVFTWWMQESKEDPVELAEVVEQVEITDSNQPQEAIVIEAPEQVDHQVNLGNVSPENSADEPDESTEIDQNAASNNNIDAGMANGPEVVEASATGGNTGQTRLTITFNEESWAEIFDARKRRLLHGLIKPGATRVISGQAPFSVFLGNSPGVEFKINGEKYDHSPYIRGNKTARFQIDDQNT
jgi:cytoskeleton protein RodZ